MSCRFLSLLITSLTASVLLAQELPQTTIPISEIRNMLGVSSNENFALVYKGDTLASQVIDGAFTRSSFFDECITYINFKDSLEFRYSLPLKEGILRMSLPDSTTLFSKEFWMRDSSEHIVRYDANGKETFKMDVGRKQKSITRISEHAKRQIKSSQSGWSKHYHHLGLDSSYVAYYSLDSVLTSQSILVNFPNEEQMHIYSKMNPYHYSLRRSYSSRDSSYYYIFNTRDGDTSITDNLNHSFRDIDSTYSCNSYSYISNGTHGFTQKFESSNSDSSFGYSSANGGSIGWMLENDTFKISKSYNLNGKLIGRERVVMEDDYLVEEILEKQDSFYHVINCHHKLYWKGDTNHITTYFPYYSQIYLNQDSIVIKELNYSFEKEYDWPVLTITIGDSTWTENTSAGFSSKYARKVFICPGAITTGSAIYKADENSFNFKGVGSKKIRKQLLKNLDAHLDLMFGVGVPPLYFIYVQSSGSAHHSFLMPSSKNYQSFIKILSESTTRKASLYVDGELNKIDCTFLKLDFDWYWSRPNR